MTFPCRDFSPLSFHRWLLQNIVTYTGSSLVESLNVNDSRCYPATQRLQLRSRVEKPKVRFERDSLTRLLNGLETLLSVLSSSDYNDRVYEHIS